MVGSLRLGQSSAGPHGRCGAGRDHIAGLHFGVLGYSLPPLTLQGMATAATNTAQLPPTRRWERHKFQLEIFLRVSQPNGHKTIQARGCQLNEGGMSVFVGAELAVGENVEVELTPPYANTPMKLKAAILNRDGYYYGLEFIATNSAEQREIELLRLVVRALMSSPSMQARDAVRRLLAQKGVAL